MKLSIKTVILYIAFMSACGYSLLNSAQTVLDKAEEQRIERLYK